MQKYHDYVALFRDYVLGLRQVLRLYHIAGTGDFLRDSDALRDFAMDALTTGSEANHLGTGLIFSCCEPGEA
ncbi:hypothetical protein NOR51B_324 [Luminiphilus syltensis NOR5-1B]|uniref:Uncharacterized protein n=1 Tax=Luminiphilus syltensis NOR5-1B TaxID=565045 RepID=B8KY21_9GAMM|nr:hypothetical protein [Luminiphilus syltensis]EED34387.1 hypothetical protein NOR51B_324 [Luminiphilus syltensis NOR5-1B]